MTRANLGQHIRITKDENSAPIGSVVIVKEAFRTCVYYDFFDADGPIEYSANTGNYEVIPMTRATPGDRIRITEDENGAPVGSVVEVSGSTLDRVTYVLTVKGRAGTFFATHACYEVIA